MRSMNAHTTREFRTIHDLIQSFDSENVYIPINMDILEGICKIFTLNLIMFYNNMIPFIFYTLYIY